ncbi:hypothetical protein MtrunA17_Chr8g0392881 [Medicago truncatula]|uniref:Uncharacterized protein n=1 Tax=Medicago truncatula TaxID=3880 RepID=A0A396GTN0_MEDTR|nr:hypothetical protein MtrunA17_Chr8g0392881 [Medicago truncatula]
MRPPTSYYLQLENFHVQSVSGRENHVESVNPNTSLVSSHSCIFLLWRQKAREDLNGSRTHFSSNYKYE